MTRLIKKETRLEKWKNVFEKTAISYAGIFFGGKLIHQYVYPDEAFGRAADFIFYPFMFFAVVLGLLILLQYKHDKQEKIRND